MTGAQLIFDPTDHTYWRPPGRVTGLNPVPNVTSILQAVGVSCNFEQVPQARLEHRGQLGSAVHTDCHAFDDDDLIWESVHPLVVPYIDAWRTFREHMDAQPLHRERRVYHPTLHYCGTLDGIFVVRGLRQVLIDLKIGDPDDAAAQFQTAAYAEAHRAEYPDVRIDERWAVQLCPGLTIPYRVTPYRDYLDFRKFSAFLTTYHEQHSRRRRTL